MRRARPFDQLSIIVPLSNIEDSYAFDNVSCDHLVSRALHHLDERTSRFRVHHCHLKLLSDPQPQLAQVDSIVHSDTKEFRVGTDRDYLLYASILNFVVYELKLAELVFDFEDKQSAFGWDGLVWIQERSAG